MVRSLGVCILLSLVSLPLAAAQWDGVVDWTQRTEMSTAVTGVVSQVTAVPGERVKKGQLLLTLEQGAIRARLAQRNAEMKHKSLLRTEARKELDRAEELYARTLLADHDLELAKVAFAEADAAYQLTRADVSEAQQTLAQSQIKAPLDAVVIARHVQPGQTVVSRCDAQPMLTLAAVGRMKVRFAVALDEAGSIAQGKSATVEVGAKRYSGKVTRIAYEPQSVNGTLRYPAEVEFAVERPLRIGQQARVSIP